MWNSINKMLNYIGSFLLGVYVGQEYGTIIPRVKTVFKKIMEQIKESIPKKE